MFLSGIITVWYITENNLKSEVHKIKLITHFDPNTLKVFVSVCLNAFNCLSSLLPKCEWVCGHVQYMCGVGMSNYRLFIAQMLSV